MSKRMFRIIAVLAVLVLALAGCTDPKDDGGAANREQALEIITTAQDTVKGAARVVADTVDEAAEALGAPENPLPGAQEDFENGSPKLLDAAARLAKLVVCRDDCAKYYKGEALTGCQRNCEILYSQ